MEQIKNMEFKVGVFVAAGLLLLCISILLLGGDRMLFKKHYRLKTQMSQVQGLAEGSVVSLAGLTVGNVEKMDFSSDQNQLVLTLKLDQKFQDRIREGSTAEVRTQGALGDKYVYIAPGPLQNKVLNDGGLVTALDGADFLSVIASKSDSVSEVFEIIHELKVLVKTINGNGRSQNIMNNLQASSSGIKQALDRLNHLLADVQGESADKAGLKKTLLHLSNVLQKVDRGDGTLGALINDPTIHESLKAFLGTSPRQRYIKGFVRDAIQVQEKSK